MERAAFAMPARSSRPSTVRRPATTTTSSPKRAALLESLLVNQTVVDGNKRTAFAVADIFLRLNGHRIVASTDEAHATITGVPGSGDGRFQRLDTWLRDHVEPLGR